ncbi:unnamed protein product, partial [Notodromas monacha]
MCIDPFHVPKKLCRNQSYEAVHQRRGRNSSESFVLVLYTGGTIGMIKNDQGVLAPAPKQLEQHIRSYPHLHDVKYADHYHAYPTAGTGTMRTISSTKRDSTNSSNEGTTMYHLYDGFVVLHGTDTMAYTASALSFMLENLGKTVILTGSQDRVAFMILLNFYKAEFVVSRRPGVSNVCQDIKKRKHACRMHYKDIFRPSSLEKFIIHPKMNSNVGLLRLFPSISLATIRSFLQPPIEGVVLQSYGAGNIPSNRADILREITEAVKQRGVVIINISQCQQGSVESAYATGKASL